MLPCYLGPLAPSHPNLTFHPLRSSHCSTIPVLPTIPFHTHLSTLDRSISYPSPRTHPFVFAVTEKLLARDPMEDLRRAFALFDDDHTGKISLKNLRRVAKELGENLGEEELYVWFEFVGMLADAECLASSRLASSRVVSPRVVRLRLASTRC